MQITEEQFRKEIAEHKMTVLHDQKTENGHYRHIRFARPDTVCYSFSLITYPNHLVYSGDMGTYVFSRLNDMFQFFRSDRTNKENLDINLGYWAEKLQAEECSHGVYRGEKESEEKIKESVNSYLENWMEGLSEEQQDELKETVSDEIFSLEGEKERMCFAVHDFSFEQAGKIYKFTDFWESSTTEYDHRFIWCNFAIAWGIFQYDQANTVVEVTA